jgi:lysophospholipase L1-like esterase
MRLRRGLALILLVGLPLFSAAQKRPRRRGPPPAPRVSAAARAASLHKVAGHLERSTGDAFAQPGALVPVFEQLHRLTSTPERPAVHMVHFGASHTAADEWTGGLRDLLTERFGDGGSGFSLAGRPFLGYRRFDARGGSTGQWRAEGLRSANGDGFFGLGGVSITANRPGQSVYLETECDSLELHYLQQPGGGEIALYDGDQPLEQLSTDGSMGAGFVRYETPPGPHRFTLKTLDSRPVRLFGWVADRQSGVTYEALGINGAQASVMLRWNDEILDTYLQRRNPAMIVLAYGTNEASDPNWSGDSYQAMFSSLLQRLRQTAPAATILVLGPPDRMSRSRGTWRPYDRLDPIVAAQKAACRENRCAFWDTRQRMGGKGSMRDWVYAGLAQGDYVHFNSAGYRRLAAILYADLMREYETYAETRTDR